MDSREIAAVPQRIATEAVDQMTKKVESDIHSALLGILGDDGPELDAIIQRMKAEDDPWMHCKELAAFLRQRDLLCCAVRHPSATAWGPLEYRIYKHGELVWASLYHFRRPFA